MVLGPIFVLKAKSVPADLGVKVVAELWLYPDGSLIMELSAKSDPELALRTAVKVADFLRPPRHRSFWASSRPRRRRRSSSSPTDSPAPTGCQPPTSRARSYRCDASVRIRGASHRSWKSWSRSSTCVPRSHCRRGAPWTYPGRGRRSCGRSAPGRPADGRAAPRLGGHRRPQLGARLRGARARRRGRARPPRPWTGPPRATTASRWRPVPTTSPRCSTSSGTGRPSSSATRWAGRSASSSGAGIPSCVRARAVLDGGPLLRRRRVTVRCTPPPARRPRRPRPPTRAAGHAVTSAVVRRRDLPARWRSRSPTTTGRVFEAALALGRFDSRRWLRHVDVPVGLITTLSDHVVPTRRQLAMAGALRPVTTPSCAAGTPSACAPAPASSPRSSGLSGRARRRPGPGDRRALAAAA